MNRVVVELIKELQRLYNRYMLLRKPREWGIGVLLGVSLVINSLKELIGEDCECKSVEEILKDVNYKCKG